MARSHGLLSVQSHVPLKFSWCFPSVLHKQLLHYNGYLHPARKHHFPACTYRLHESACRNLHLQKECSVLLHSNHQTSHRWHPSSLLHLHLTRLIFSAVPPFLLPRFQNLPGKLHEQEYHVHILSHCRQPDFHRCRQLLLQPLLRLQSLLLLK